MGCVPPSAKDVRYQEVFYQTHEWETPQKAWLLFSFRKDGRTKKRTTKGAEFVSWRGREEVYREMEHWIGTYNAKPE